MKQLNVVKNSKKFFIISICIVVITLLATFIMGVRLDIQFKGGSIINYSHQGDLAAKDFQSAVEEQLKQKVTLQEQTNVKTGNMNYVISLTGSEGLSVEAQSALTSALQAKFPNNEIDVMELNNVNPTIGKEFFAKCLVAVGFAALLMVVYIAFRFRKIGGWSAGVMCVVALLHDMIIIYAVFVICRFPINDNFIAVLLTILGYSINATIVVYDRIRENKKRMGQKVEVGELVDVSVNQSFSRTLNTTITTATAMLIICIIAMMRDVGSIITFAFPLLIGIIAGLYSSICLSGPLWVAWQRYKAGKRRTGKA